MPKRQLSDERAQLADSLGQDVADGQADLGIPHYESTQRVPRNEKDNGGFHRLGVGDRGRPVERGRVAERLAGGDVVEILFPAVGGALEDPDGSRLDEVEPLRGLALRIDQRAFLVVSPDQPVANRGEDVRRQAREIRMPTQDGQRVVHALLRGVPSLAHPRKHRCGDDEGLWGAKGGG